MDAGFAKAMLLGLIVFCAMILGLVMIVSGVALWGFGITLFCGIHALWFSLAGAVLAIAAYSIARLYRG